MAQPLLVSIPHRLGRLRSAPDLVPRREPRELHLDEVEVILNAVKVAADLIGLVERGRR